MVSGLDSRSSPGSKPCWGKHFTLTVLLSTMQYEWVKENCWDNLTKSLGIFERNTISHFTLQKPEVCFGPKELSADTDEPHGPSNPFD